MKKFLFATSAAALMTAGLVGGASAGSISDQVGAPLIDLASTSGNFYNLALNLATIDGSVTVTANTETSTTYYSDGTAQITEATASLGNLGDIATTAVGAVNDGTIALGNTTSHVDTSGAMSVSVGSLEYADNVNDTASSIGDSSAASYSADNYVNVTDGSFSGSLNNVTDTTGPMADTIAMNVAYNNTDSINGSVDITGANASATGIATTVAGAINTGSITSGIPTN